MLLSLSTYKLYKLLSILTVYIFLSLISVPDHDGGRPIEVNACILITHMVYL
jgi:hypothetical protein